MNHGEPRSIRRGRQRECSKRSQMLPSPSQATRKAMRQSIPHPPRGREHLSRFAADKSASLLVRFSSALSPSCEPPRLLMKSGDQSPRLKALGRSSSRMLPLHLLRCLSLRRDDYRALGINRAFRCIARRLLSAPPNEMRNVTSPPRPLHFDSFDRLFIPAESDLSRDLSRTSSRCIATFV